MTDPEKILAGITKLSGIPVCHYSAEGRLLKSFQFPYNPQYLPGFYRDMITDCIAGARKERIFHRVLEGLPVIALSCRMDDDSCYVWGPVAYGHFTQAQQYEYERLCLASDFQDDILFSPIDRITTGIKLFLSIATGRDLSEELLFGGIPSQPDMENTHRSISKRIINDEALSKNHSIAEEVIVLDAVRRGDIDYVKTTLNTGTPDYPQAVRDNYKNEEYMTASVIAVITRAAVSGGLSSGNALRLSDEYLRRLASCESAMECIRLRNEVILTFTQLVAENREEGTANRYITQAKRMIRENINDAISLDDIAAKLHVNASYLSRIFKIHQGCTVTEYIQRRKIRQAKNLLVYSDDDIIAISAWLGFSSAGYFTKVFKAHEGCTPSQYRFEHQR